MTTDDLIPLLEQAGICQGVWFEHHHSIERFAALVAASEKELIAQWIESWGNDLTIKDIVEGIRTNGNGATRPLKYVTREEPL